MGTLGVCTIFWPAWLVAAAMVDGLYHGLAGLEALPRIDRNLKDTVAMVSDGFVSLRR
jgi:hypothetical protein